MSANALATDLARALDPVTLAVQSGIVPDTTQGAVLRSAAPRVLLNCFRQWGKSTIASIIVVHGALYEPGCLQLYLSPSMRQSQELFLKSMALYRMLGRPVTPQAENQLSLVLETGSRIVSLPASESTIRGFSNVRRLVVDEAAQVPDEVYFSALPMLSPTRGQLVAMSTPHGRRGWFHDEWHDLDQPWERHEVPVTRSDRIPADELERRRRSMGSWWFEQEYMCRFADVVDSVFATDFIAAMVDADLEPLFAGGVRG